MKERKQTKQETSNPRAHAQASTRKHKSHTHKRGQPVSSRKHCQAHSNGPSETDINDILDEEHKRMIKNTFKEIKEHPDSRINIRTQTNS